MKISDAKFIISATKKEQYPNNNFPQIVLIGKSNVGKSSFINCLTNMNKLAKTSSTPGKTRLINFYEINNSFYFVDLPGYGYSQMSKQEEIKSSKFINEYLLNCNNISLILFLIDIRHSPTTNDIIMFNWLIENRKNFIIIANKSDKIAKTKIPEYISNISKIFKLKDFGLENSINILPFSSITKDTKESLLDILDIHIKKAQ